MRTRLHNVGPLAHFALSIPQTCISHCPHSWGSWLVLELGRAGQGQGVSHRNLVLKPVSHTHQSGGPCKPSVEADLCSAPLLSCSGSPGSSCRKQCKTCTTLHFREWGKHADPMQGIPGAGRAARGYHVHQEIWSACTLQKDLKGSEAYTNGWSSFRTEGKG